MAKTFTKIKWEGPKGKFIISPDLCKGCGLCLEKCPSQVIDWSGEMGVYGTPIVEAKRIERCTACRICALVCPDAAIDIEKVDAGVKRKEPICALGPKPNRDPKKNH